MWFQTNEGEVRHNFWSVRVVAPWNALTDQVTGVDALDSFKNSMDNIMERERKNRVGKQWKVQRK